MTAIPDPIDALVTFLKADTDLAALVAARIYGVDLDEGETENMPQKAVTLRPAGGGTAPMGYVRAGDSLIDAHCYGETFHIAGEVRLAVLQALKHLRRNVTANVLLHWVRPAGGPIAFRDPETDWPVYLQTFQVLASETAVA